MLPQLPGKPTYTEIAQAFRWDIPEYFNIGSAVCDQQPQDKPALIVMPEQGAPTIYNFATLKKASNQLCNLFVAKGLVAGDRVAILLSQSVETATSHIAIYKAGMIAVPLFVLFATDALRYRLATAGVRALVTDATGFAKILPLLDDLPMLEQIIVTEPVGGQLPPGRSLIDYHQGCAAASDQFTPVATRADDPALIIFTSGTTGNPKGALHAHRVLLGHLPGVEFPHNLFPQKGDRFWTPADWAWIGGLLDVLLPSLFHGVAVVAHRASKFDPEASFALMARAEIRNVFFPPTALKLMRQVPNPKKRHAFCLRSIGSGGESLGQELLAWGQAECGLMINEFYGQTECNLIVGNCSAVMPVKPGAMGRAIPGHQLAIIDADGVPLPAGSVGHIAVKRPDPVMFLGYWGNEAATREKFIGNWLITGDQGHCDEEGYFFYQGRQDDIITTAGYRVGPGEIEDCLLKHPAVAMAGVIGVPDPIRTEAITAFIVLAPGYSPATALVVELQHFVKQHLAAHEYPRQIHFIAEMPLTTTGKIIRKALRAMAPTMPAIDDPNHA